MHFSPQANRCQPMPTASNSQPPRCRTATTSKTPRRWFHWAQSLQGLLGGCGDMSATWAANPTGKVALQMALWQSDTTWSLKPIQNQGFARWDLVWVRQQVVVKYGGINPIAFHWISADHQNAEPSGAWPAMSYQKAEWTQQCHLVSNVLGRRSTVLRLDCANYSNQEPFQLLYKL